MVQLICSLALLALWPAVTSHSLLERLDWIHIVHADHHHGETGTHEHNADNHQFADGDYHSAKGATTVAKAPPMLRSSSFLAGIVRSVSWIQERMPGPAPPSGFAPPLLAVSWQFETRTALPVRAPSILL